MRLILLVTSLVLIIACKKSETSVSCNPLISFDAEVKAIFVTNCSSSGCHDGVILPSLADFQTVHDASAQIRVSVGKGRMPLNKTISERDKAAILCWIDNGSQHN